MFEILSIDAMRRIIRQNLDVFRVNKGEEDCPLGDMLIGMNIRII
jgi:hypothetical protein